MGKLAKRSHRRSLLGLAAAILVMSSRPTAITKGPIVSGILAPIRCAKAPARGESTSIKAVTGKVAAPAAIGE